MTWRISTQHRSVYHYQAPVVASYNEARLTPATSPRQSVISSSVVINPAGPRYTYVDYWSSVVVAFDVEARHEGTSP